MGRKRRSKHIVYLNEINKNNYLKLKIDYIFLSLENNSIFWNHPNFNILTYKLSFT